jgi:hypothetical protein
VSGQARGCVSRDGRNPGMSIPTEEKVVDFESREGGHKKRSMGGMVWVGAKTGGGLFQDGKP